MLALLLCCLPIATPFERELDFKQIAKDYLAGLGRSSSNLSFRALQREFFATTSIGLFELSFPRSALADKRDFDDIRDSAQALCSAQLRFLEWASVDTLDVDASEEVEAVRDWIAGWNGPAIARALDAGAGRFEPGESDTSRQPWTQLRERMLAFGATGPDPLDPVGLTLVPERSDFVGLTATLGWIDTNARSKLWLDNIPTWTFFYYGESQVLALRFGTPDDGNIHLGERMDSRNPAGMEQHVVQLALRSLLRRVLHYRLSPTLNAGLAANLVIDLYGEVDTRTDGDMRARSTQPRTVFVPGGAPEGGTLPALSAESPWRLPKQGGDHFLPVLRRSQKSADRMGGKRSDRNLRFEIRSDSQREKLAISAPFLIPLPWRGSLPGPQFRGNQLEFMRCYRSAFVHWMCEEADGKDSHATFAHWLNLLASSPLDLNASIADAYGMPLSNDEVDKKCLEGRFLRWLAKR